MMKSEHKDEILECKATASKMLNRIAEILKYYGNEPIFDINQDYVELRNMANEIIRIRDKYELEVKYKVDIN